MAVNGQRSGKRTVYWWRLNVKVFPLSPINLNWMSDASELEKPDKIKRHYENIKKVYLRILKKLRYSGIVSGQNVSELIDDELKVHQFYWAKYRTLV